MPLAAKTVRRATRPPGVRLEDYPYSDGRVLMETDPHANSIVAMRNQLQWHFEARSDVYVAGSMAVYWQKNVRSAVVVPDVLVVLGVEKRDRQSYRVWKEGGVVPTFVVEVASKSTVKRDEREKRATYEVMGVPEYWRFDPLGKWIPSGLEGWRLGVSGYEKVLEAGEGGYYQIELLGLEMRAEGWLLRFRDEILGRDLLTHSETHRWAETEAAAREEAEQARDAANRRAETEAAAREAAEQAREAADRRAETEAAAREAAEQAREAADRRAEREAAARASAELECDEANRRIRELEARQRFPD